PICTASAEQYLPAIAAGTNGYLVVWLDHRNGRSGSFDMYGARVTSSGIVEDPDGIPIVSADRDSSAAGSPAVAANGNSFFVVWSDNSIYGKRVDGDGTVPEV